MTATEWNKLLKRIHQSIRDYGYQVTLVDLMITDGYDKETANKFITQAKYGYLGETRY